VPIRPPALRDGDGDDGSALLGLAGEEVEGLEVAGCRLVRPDWTGAQLTRARLTDVVIEDGELAGLTLDECSLLRVAFVRCRLTGIVAPALRATDVTFEGCRMEDAWLRAATFERVGFDDCALARADLYSARLQQVRLVGCDHSEIEISQAQLDDVAFHRSTIEGLKGGSALRSAVISTDQILGFAGPVFHAAGIRVDDDYLEPPSAP
jgi:uncharacterized protein YjbI with pentapeptide repeats